MSKTIKCSLSVSSIEKAIKELNSYKEWLEKKTVQLRNQIALEIGVLAETKFNGAIYDDVLHEGMKVPDVRVDADDKGNISVVVAYGKEAVFAEFGAGVYYNGPVGSYPHPNTPPGIVAIGTYGKGYGARKVWGYYENGELKLTHGTPASMPMYHAVQEIIPKIPEIARKVFQDESGGGAT